MPTLGVPRKAEMTYLSRPAQLLVKRIHHQNTLLLTWITCGAYIHLSEEVFDRLSDRTQDGFDFPMLPWPNVAGSPTPPSNFLHHYLTLYTVINICAVHQLNLIRNHLGRTHSPALSKWFVNLWVIKIYYVIIKSIFYFKLFVKI